MDVDTKIFAVMWDNLGIETVAEIPHPALNTWAALTNQPPPHAPNLNLWAYRARINTQRHYEIYLVTTQADITAQDLRQMFKSNPRMAADTIRERGQCFFSSGDKSTQKVIT
jgi:hypothetical protein